jgi:chemotaxis protein histidine kinase CheA
MQLNELFEQYSIETIEAKTNIPKEKLADLKEADWSKFKRAQALGFLNILEREFNIALNEPKADCKAYFEQIQPQKSAAKIDFVDSQVAKSNNGGVVSKVIAVVTLAALGYAGWYYYNKNYQNSFANFESNKTQESQEVNKTKSNTEQNSSQSSIKKDTPKEAPKESQKSINKVAQSSNTEQNSSPNQKFDITDSAQNSTNKDSALKEQNITNNSTNITKKEDIKAEVETLLNEANRSLDKNSTSQNVAKASSSTNNALDNNLKTDSVTDANSSADANSTANAVTDANSVADTNSIAEADATKATEQSDTQSQDNSEITSDDLASAQTQSDTQDSNIEPIDNVKVVVKSKRLWLGIYNLESGKKVSKIIKKGTTLDLTNGKLAIITGHSRLNLVTNNETKSFKKRGKMYLLISQNEGIKVITKQEYKKLTNNRAW